MTLQVDGRAQRNQCDRPARRGSRQGLGEHVGWREGVDLARKGAPRGAANGRGRVAGTQDMTRLPAVGPATGIRRADSAWTLRRSSEYVRGADVHGALGRIPRASAGRCRRPSPTRKGPVTPRSVLDAPTATSGETLHPPTESPAVERPAGAVKNGLKSSSAARGPFDIRHILIVDVPAVNRFGRTDRSRERPAPTGPIPGPRQPVGALVASLPEAGDGVGATIGRGRSGQGSSLCPRLRRSLGRTSSLRPNFHRIQLGCAVSSSNQRSGRYACRSTSVRPFCDRGLRTRPLLSRRPSTPCSCRAN